MHRKLSGWLGSRKFFYLIVGFLVFQAAWIALSGRYPMAFDEDFHLGIIQLYAHHLSPFWSSPVHEGALGPVSRDPSYLYQFLLSFPYRLISTFTHSTTIQVLILRFINIGLLASALPFYKKLLIRARLSTAAANSVLLLYVLIPVVPFQAAQINYDNLLIPVVAGTLLLACMINDELATYKRLNTIRLGWLAVACLLGSLVTYVFLPIFAIILLWLGWQVWRNLGFGRKFWRTLGFGLTLVSKRLRWVLLICVAGSLGLFGERYGVNLVRYHFPFPDCAQVLTVEECSDYGPWYRDYIAEAHKGQVDKNPVTYSGTWFGGMWVRLFFAVAGPDDDFETKGPLTLPSLSVVVWLAGGVVLLASSRKRIIYVFQNQTVRLLVLVSGFYALILWVDNYGAYVRTGQPVAINGRYLLPIIPLAVVPFVLAYQSALLYRPRIKAGLAAAAVVCMLWGGGWLTFVLRSNDSWYWPNPAVKATNHAVQKVLSPIVPGTNDPTKYLFAS